jgi:hypothetical protein
VPKGFIEGSGQSAIVRPAAGEHLAGGTDGGATLTLARNPGSSLVGLAKRNPTMLIASMKIYWVTLR